MAVTNPHLTAIGKLAPLVMLLCSHKSGSSYSLIPHSISSASPLWPHPSARALPPYPLPVPTPFWPPSPLAWTIAVSIWSPASLSSSHEASFHLTEIEFCADTSRALTAKRLKSELRLGFQVCHQPHQPTFLLPFQPASY